MKETIYLLQGRYAGYWETLYETPDKEEVYEDLELYNLNEKDYLHRVIKQTRVILETEVTNV